MKKGSYVYLINKRKSHKIAMRESLLTQDEFVECEDELEDLARMLKFTVIYEGLADNKTSNVLASKAGCSVDEIYEWYFKGRAGEDEYVEFYEHFHKLYVRPNIVPIQEKLDSENININILIKSNKDKFTKKDFDIWVKNGLIDTGVVHLDDDEKDSDEDDEKNTLNINRKVSNSNNARSSLGRVQDDLSVEDLKKELLRK